MNAYLLKRVLAFGLVFLAIELAASLSWWVFHASDRRAVSELAPRIEEVSGRLREERGWLVRRRAVGDSLDAVSDRIAEGPDAFASRAALDSARARHTRRIRSWNAEIAEHERRYARLDSLSTARDQLVDAWIEAYRRAYPGWLLLPRPAPPGHVGGPVDERGSGAAHEIDRAWPRFVDALLTHEPGHRTRARTVGVRPWQSPGRELRRARGARVGDRRGSSGRARGGADRVRPRDRARGAAGRDLAPLTPFGASFRPSVGETRSGPGGR